MPLTDPNKPINAADLAPGAFDLSGEHVDLKTGPGITRGDNGVQIDDGYVLALIPAQEASGPDVRVISHGFDPDREILTLNMSDQTQIEGGMPGIVTEAKLAARQEPMTSAFGRPIPYNSVQ